MRISRLLAAITAFTLLATPALAGPVPAFITTAFAVFGFTAQQTAVIMTALVSTAVSTGLAYASKLFQNIPLDRRISGAQLQMGTGGVVPRSILVGNYATAGSLAYWGTWGTDGDTPNAFITHVIAIGDVPIVELTEVWEGATKGEYDTGQTLQTQGYPIVAFQKGGVDNLWIKFYDGTQTVADSFLTTIFGSDPDYPYGSDRKGIGVPHVIVTARRNSQFFVGRPEYRFVGIGAKFYDQRLDSTEGGSGSHRFNDQATWAATSNPIVIINNILRGISYNGSHLYGLQGLPTLRVPSASWFAAMNECDALIDDMDGNPVAQYRCGCEIPVNIAPASAIETLLMSCNGRIAEIGGIYKVLAGAPGSAVLGFFDENIIVSQPQSFDLFPTIDQAINGLTATYMEPEAGWEPKDLPLRKNDDAVDQDGENYLAVNYAAVFDPGQAQRLQTAALNEAQNHRKHSHTLPPGALILEPLDVVSWTSTRNGYISKAFLCTGVTIAPNLDIPIAISELDPTDYDFDPDTDHLPISVPFLTAPILPNPTNAPTGFAAYQSGSTVTFTWDLMVNYGFTGYDLLYAPLGSPIGSATYLAQDVRSNVIAFSSIPAGDYTFFVVGRDSLDIPGQAARGAAASINFTVVAIQEQTNQQLIAAQEALEALAAAQVRQTIAQWAATQNNFAASARATNVLEQNVILGQSAIARNSMELEVRLVGADITLAASVISEQEARIDADGVIASDVTTLSTTVGSHTATLTSHASSINGLHAEWGVEINVDGRVTGAVRLDGGAFTSNFVVVADNFYIFPAGGSEVPMFSITGGVAKFTIPLIANLVDTDAIQDYAVTLAGITEDASETAAAGGSAWTLLISRTESFTGRQIQVDCSCDIKATDSNHLYAFAITLDGTNPESAALYNPIVGAGPVFDISASGTWRSWSRQIDTIPGAGSHTLRVYGKSDSTAIKFLNKAIRTSEVKK